MAEEKNAPNFYEDERAASGIKGWIFSTDHKRIGLLYMYSMFSFFLIGVLLGFLMRLELIAPGKTIMSADLYNAAFTLHGVIMIFLFVLPGVPAIFGNFFLPIMLGAKDVSFPRLNLLSWWVFMTGAVVAVTSLFTGGGAPDTGWTFYAPYSINASTNVSLAVFGAFLIGFSSILTGLNFITTIHRLRAPGMTWFRMPLFAWGLYSTAWIQLIATPIVGITLLLVIFDRTFHIGVFDPARGGDPILFQHLFWIYSHPAVYVMILPAMGVVSEIIPTFTKKSIFGYKTIAFSSMAIAFIGYLVWGHHMFTSGMSDVARIVFSFFTFFVAIPTGMKIFNWVATLYKGSIDLKTPMLYTLSFLFLFCVAGFTGMVNATLSADIFLHDTHFVVAHFHYSMFGGVAFVMFAALHYWFPKMYGRMYKEKPAVIAWAISFIGFNVMYGAMFVAGLQGMPRRYYDYLPKFHTANIVATVGSWILVAGLLMMLANLLLSLKKGEKCGDNPWGSVSLEWQISSPPPLENFDEIPHIDCDPYDYTKGGKA